MFFAEMLSKEITSVFSIPSAFYPQAISNPLLITILLLTFHFNFVSLFRFVALISLFYLLIFIFREILEPSSPGDGGWSEWGNWTQCDKTCGTGKQVRERTCTNPPPDVGGKDCEGPEEDVQNCKLTECRK